MKNQNVEIIGSVGSLCASAITLLGVRQAAGSKGVKLLGEEREVSCRLESTFTAYPSDSKGTVRALGKTGTHDAPIVEQVEESVQMALEAVAYDAYRFNHWTRNGAQTSEPASFSYVFGRQADTWIAHFVVPTVYYTMSAVVAPGDPGGTVAVSPGQVAHGNSATFTATVNAGYNFVRWEFSDGTSSTYWQTVKTNINSHLTGTAYFAAKVYCNVSAQVTAGQGAMGTASVSPTRVEAGGNATFTAMANPGYRLAKWNFSDGTYDYRAEVYRTVNSDLVGTASFEQDITVFDVYAQTSPQDTGSGMYWVIQVMPSADVLNDITLDLSGHLRRPGGDVESFSGSLSGGQTDLVTPLRYTEGEDSVTIGSLDASTTTPGYRVGEIYYNTSRMMADSLTAGYSAWDLTADDDDRVPPVGGD